MVRLTERRRAILAEKFGDLANYAVAALALGRPSPKAHFRSVSGSAGVAIWLLFTGATVVLAGESR